MADRIAFSLVDDSGAPKTDAVPVFADYRDRAGAARTPPPVTHLGGGVYGFTPADSDEEVGTVFLVDAGAGANPRRMSGNVTTKAAPFLAWHLEAASGALWAGAAPAFGSYTDFAGTPRSPPAVVTVAGAYLFAATPSAADLAVDVAFRIDSPVGAFPSYLGGSIELPAGYAPAPGTTRNPALDLVNFLDTKAAGSMTLAKATNLFAGPMRGQDSTPAPAVFCLNTGGPSGSELLGGHRASLQRPTVQVMLRGPAGDIEAGEAIGRALLEWLHLRDLSGYVGLYVREPQPAFLGEDGDQHGLWVLNVECLYKATLA